MDDVREADRIAEGARARDAGQWEAARAAFAAALAAEDTPAARDGLGEALWFLGSVEEGIAERGRAFEGFVRAGDPHEAARCAVWIAHQCAVSGRASAARGWLARAERALEGAERGYGHAWVAIEHARHAEGVDECAALSRAALELARASGESDLEVYALSLLGRAEVAAGRRDAGLRLLDEAMAAASAGRVHNSHTLGEAYCNLITACTSAGEWERATEWCELVDEYARSIAATPLLGACRTIHADVLLASGRWEEAERALETALDAHARHTPAMGVPTTATLAELRVRQGRLAEADDLLGQRTEHPASLRALALLRIAEGRAQEAAALLERGLLAAGGDAMRMIQLLAPLVDARLACGDATRAGAAAQQLEELARETGSRLAGARADLAGARLAHATGHPDAAAELASRALAAFGRLAMPLDAAEARLELARALAPSAPELAVDEARAACAVFRELGAARAMDNAAATLRELGAGTAGRGRSHGELTEREREVLELLRLGMSNARIAQTLFISEKTAGHHVSRILSKLGVSNRAEAAAWAAREMTRG